MRHYPKATWLTSKSTSRKRTRSTARGGASAGVTFDTVRAIALTLSGAEESTSYGTPAFKVKGKLFVRFHQGGEALVVGADFEQRREMMETSPEKFYITDHYLNYPWVLVRMSSVTPDELRDLLTGAWRRAAGGKTSNTHKKRTARRLD